MDRQAARKDPAYKQLGCGDVVGLEPVALAFPSPLRLGIPIAKYAHSRRISNNYLLFQVRRLYISVKLVFKATDPDPIRL